VFFQTPAAESFATASTEPTVLIQTQIPTGTSTLTNTPTLTLTSTATLTTTATATLTSTITSTATFPPIIIYPTFTKTSKPPPPADTDTPTATAVPFAGFNVNTVSLNGGGSSITVFPGDQVTITYNFNIYDDPCPSCITQLVTGLGTAGTQSAETCAFDGDAALFPGTPGSENTILTAPSNPGTYYVTVEYSWQFDCLSALSNYGSGGSVSPQVIGTITVQPNNSVVLYSAGVVSGNIGSRATADAYCSSYLPVGYSNYHALIGYTAADNIVT